MQPQPVAPEANDGAAFRLLLSDQQLLFERARQTLYSEVAIKIQTPQGLAAGNISVPWRPETTTVTVHKLRIRRGTQIIDVLAAGQSFTTLRREQTLESATLDGVLTANIQPEGLQVGDILEFATSLSSSDPVLKGHVEAVAGDWNEVPFDQVHLRVQWPADIPLQFRAIGDLKLPKPANAGANRVIELSAKQVQPIARPNDAPPRYNLGRSVEMTDFRSWSELGALLAPLYAVASIIPAEGPLRAEIEKIRALPDPKQRAQAALALVQDRIRYVALLMGSGGLTPADAATTWSRRYGDCKGKTALLLGLLREVGIAAEPVAVNALSGDGIDLRLPIIGAFNHVLVRATIGGRVYWLDGTRTGDASLDRLRVPNFRWGLPLLPTGAALVSMIPPPLERPELATTIRIDARAGLMAPAPTTVETVLRGDSAITTNLVLSNLTGEARDRALRDYWKGRYDFIEMKSATAAFDAASGEERLVMDGVAKMDWDDGWYEADDANVGYKADFSREPGVNADAPFSVPYPFSNRVEETILLPPGRRFQPPDPAVTEIDQTVGGIEYKRHATLADNVFQITTSRRSVAPEFPAKDAPTVQKTLRALAEKRVFLRRPGDYLTTPQDLAALETATPTTAREFFMRGNMLADNRRLADAIAAYDRAEALEAGQWWTIGNRALARSQSGDLIGAERDARAALAIMPRSAAAHRALGVVAHRRQQHREAIAHFTSSLEAEPNSIVTLGMRLESEMTVGDMAAAMRDADTIIKALPDMPDAHARRAWLLHRRGERSQGDAAIKAFVTAHPKMAAAHRAMGEYYLWTDRRAEALASFDAAIAIEPSAIALAARSFVRPAGDLVGRQKDVDAALKLDPALPQALDAQIRLQRDRSEPSAAVATLTKLLSSSPQDVALLEKRAEARRAVGDRDGALADATAALAISPKKASLHLLRANIFLSLGRPDDALKEAAAAESAAPDDPFAQVVAANLYDSLDRKTEAARAFERALALDRRAYIYLNRALRRRKADVDGRREDIDAALKLDPTMREALVAKADLLIDIGDAPQATAFYAEHVDESDSNPTLLIQRGIFYAKTGDTVRADQDFAAARKTLSGASDLNNLCWMKAVAGVASQSALVDCNEALAQNPAEAAFLNSRGLVHIRLGQYDQAIADYNRALAKRERDANSLFGRAIAWSRKGNKAKAEADAAAAVKLEPKISETFEDMNLTLRGRTEG